jgi:hypothetical protein
VAKAVDFCHCMQSQIDNVNITALQNITATQKQAANNYLHKYRTYIDTLHVDKSVEGSLTNLKIKEQSEQNEYEKTINNISQTSSEVEFTNVGSC